MPKAPVEINVLIYFAVLMDIDQRELSDKKFVLLFITSSKEFRWKIRIHQISTHKVQRSGENLEVANQIFFDPVF